MNLGDNHPRSGARALPVKSPACAVSLSPENSSGFVEKIMENPQNPSNPMVSHHFPYYLMATWGYPHFQTHPSWPRKRPFFWLGQGSVSMIQKIDPLMLMKFLFIYIYIYICFLISPSSSDKPNHKQQ